MQSTSLRFKILAPLSAMIVVLLCAFVTGIYFIQNCEVCHEVTEAREAAQNLIRDGIDRYTENMKISLGFLSRDPELQSAWMDRDVNLLSQRIAERSRLLADSSQPSRLCLIDTDLVSIWHLQKGIRFYDSTRLGTVQKAGQTGRAITGIGLVCNGTIALHIVYPWVIRGKVQGYFDMSMDMSVIAEEARELLDIDIILAVSEEYARKHLTNNAWTSLPHVEGFVIAETNFPGRADDIARFLDPSNDERGDTLGGSFSLLDSYRHSHQALVDFAGDTIGTMVIINDFSKQVSYSRRAIAGYAFLSILVGGLLLWSFSILLGRIERKLLDTKSELMTALRDWEETFDVIDYAITLHDTNYTIRKSNLAARKLLDTEDILWEQPDKCFRLFHHKDQCIGECPGRLALETGQPQRFEMYEESLGKHLEISVFPRFDDKGKAIGYVHIAHDITDRVKAQARIRQLSKAMEQSANMICITDTEGIIEYVNKAFSQVTGYSDDEIKDRPFSILGSGKESDEFYSQLWEVILDGQTWTGQHECKRKDGHLYWVRMTISQILNEKDEITNFLVVQEDITGELEMRQRMSEADKMAAVGVLAAGVSHEFKNYLGGIIGNATFTIDQLQQEPDNALALETLSEIVTMAEQANEVAMSLLTYSRPRPDEKTEEDLVQLVKSTLTLVAKEFRQQGIEVATYFAPSVPKVPIEPGKIQQLLLNLLINAQQAISGEGIITVSVTSDRSNVFLRIGDTGSGIPDEIVTKIFDPFFSTKGVWGKDEVAGTGMGLSICRNTAHEHGGRLAVESLPGVGTTFTLSLPVSAKDQEASVDIEREPGGNIRLLLFTLDKHIVTSYFQESCAHQARMISIDSLSKCPQPLSNIADMTVLDASFAGKIELLKMAELSRRQAVPYVVVRAGAMDVALEDLYNHAVSVFEDLPQFDQIITGIDQPTRMTSPKA